MRKLYRYLFTSLLTACLAVVGAVNGGDDVTDTRMRCVTVVCSWSTSWNPAVGWSFRSAPRDTTSRWCRSTSWKTAARWRRSWWVSSTCRWRAKRNSGQSNVTLLLLLSLFCSSVIYEPRVYVVCCAAGKVNLSDCCTARHAAALGPLGIRRMYSGVALDLDRCQFLLFRDLWFEIRPHPDWCFVW